MKNRVIKNFLMFIGFWLLFTIGMNFFKHRALLANFPWEVLLIFLLSLIPLVSKISRGKMYLVNFVIFFVYMLINGGYYNWTSLIIFAMMAGFLSVVTAFISNQFLKGKKS